MSRYVGERHGRSAAINHSGDADSFMEFDRLPITDLVCRLRGNLNFLFTIYGVRCAITHLVEPSRNSSDLLDGDQFEDLYHLLRL